MADLLYVKPANGRAVRIPNTNGHLPPAGGYVETSPYWRRRMQVGDAIQVAPPAMLEAYGAIDTLAGLLDAALAAARKGGTADAAKAALEALDAQAGPLLDVGPKCAAALSPADAAQVEAYAADKLGARATLEAMASGAAVPPPAQDKPRKPRKAGR